MFLDTSYISEVPKAGPGSLDLLHVCGGRTIIHFMSEKYTADPCCRGSGWLSEGSTFSTQKMQGSCRQPDGSSKRSRDGGGRLIVLLQEVNVAFERCANKSNELRDGVDLVCER